MLMRCRQVSRRVLSGASGGATLVEVTIAIIVLAFLVGSVPAAVLANINTRFRANEIRVAENLTRSEFEYIKSQDYIFGNVTYPVSYDYIPVNLNFGFHVDAWPIDPETGDEINLNGAGNVTRLYEKDDGIQLITVTVYGWGVRSGQPTTGAPLLVSTNYKFAYGQ